MARDARESAMMLRGDARYWAGNELICGSGVDVTATRQRASGRRECAMFTVIVE